MLLNKVPNFKTVSVYMPPSKAMYKLRELLQKETFGKHRLYKPNTEKIKLDVSNMLSKLEKNNFVIKKSELAKIKKLIIDAPFIKVEEVIAILKLHR